MADFRYFTTCEGEQVELAHVGHQPNSVFNPITGWWQDTLRPYAFMGTSPKCGEKHLAQRKIEYKRAPSLHKCNAKCMGGKVNGTCECQCGGKNHGMGSIGNPGAFRKAA